MENKLTKKKLMGMLLIAIDVMNILFLKNPSLFYIMYGILIIEYTIKLKKGKLKYLISIEGILSFVVLSISLVTPQVRVIRIISLLDLIPVFRKKRPIYSFFEIEKLQNSIDESIKYIWIFVKIIVFIFFTSGIMIYLLEHNAQPEEFATIADGFWWAFTTMSTVGYGDLVPITGAGKIFAMYVTLVSLGIIIIPSTIIAHILLKKSGISDKIESNKKDDGPLLTNLAPCNNNLDRLKELEKIFYEELISEQEYLEKKKEILKEL